MISKLKKGVFVDVGAGFGIYTIMASKILKENGFTVTRFPDGNRYATRMA